VAKKNEVTGKEETVKFQRGHGKKGRFEEKGNKKQGKVVRKTRKALGIAKVGRLKGTLEKGETTKMGKLLHYQKKKGIEKKTTGEMK